MVQKKWGAPEFLHKISDQKGHCDSYKNKIECQNYSKFYSRLINN